MVLLVKRIYRFPKHKGEREREKEREREIIQTDEFSDLRKHKTIGVEA